MTIIKTRVDGYIKVMGQTPQEGIEVRAWVVYPDEVYAEGGLIISGGKILVETDADGYFYFDLIPQTYLSPAGVIYRIEAHEVDYLVDVAASALNEGAGSTISLASLEAH